MESLPLLSTMLHPFWLTRKKTAFLLDSDVQGTASLWSLDREEDKSLPKVHVIQKFENIRNALLDLKNRYEYVIVDSPGRDCRELRTGLTAARSLIIPLKCSQPDLDNASEYAQAQKIWEILSKTWVSC